MADVVNTPDFTQQFFNLDGKPLVNGKLAFFENNTDIPASIYTAGGSVALGSEITLDSSGFPETQFALEAGKSYTVKAFDSDNVLIWTRNNVFGGGSSGVSGDFVPMTGTSIGDPIVGPLVIKYNNKTTTLGNEALQSDTGMQVTAPTVTVAANDGLANIIGTPRVSINAVGADSAQIFIQSDKKIEMQGTQIEIKAPNSGNEITINSKGLTEIIGGATSIQGNNGLVLYGGGTGITINGAANFLSTATLNNKTVNDIWTSTSSGVPSDTQLITAKAAIEAAGGMSNPMTDEGDMIVGGVGGAPERLQFGLRGQLLVMGDDGKPEWSEKPSACQENYSIVDSTGIYSASSYNDQIITSKVIANFDRVYSQIGFGLKTGQMSIPGQVGLAIYDVGKNLVARTPIFQLTEPYLGQVYWVDTENTFSLSAGNEYYFAFWTSNYPASNLIRFLGHQQVSSFDADLVGIYYGQSGLTEMPNSLSIPSLGQMVVHMAVR